MDAIIERFTRAVALALDDAPKPAGAGKVPCNPAETECHAEDPNNCPYHKTGKYAVSAQNESNPAPKGGAGGVQNAATGGGSAAKSTTLANGVECTLTDEGKKHKELLEKAISEATDPEIKAKLEAIYKEAQEKIKGMSQAEQPAEASAPESGEGGEKAKSVIPADKQGRLDYVEQMFGEEMAELDKKFAEGTITKGQHYEAAIAIEKKLEDAKAAIEKKFGSGEKDDGDKGADAPSEEGVKEVKYTGVSSDEQKSECDAQVKKLNDAMKASGMGSEVSEVRANPFSTQYVFHHDGAISSSEFNELKAKYGSGIKKPEPLGSDMFAITIQNSKVADVSFADVSSSEDVVSAASGMTAPCLLGRGVDGKPVLKDMSAMKHLLVGGKSGEGKSSVVNSVLTGMMKFKSPEDLELYLVDPQRAEFEPYGDMPHTKSYIGGMDGNSPANVSSMLDECIQEMEHRTEFFAKLGVKNLEAYRAHAEANPGKNLPRIPARIVGIDEFPMLISDKQHGAAIASKVKRLAAEARKAGIHLIVAAQDPKLTSVGDIKANMSKIAVKTETSQASRNILDSNGAEELTGKGDMYIKTDKGLLRAKGAFLNDKEDSDGNSDLKTELAGIAQKWGGKKPAEATPPPASAETPSPTPEPAPAPAPAAAEPAQTAPAQSDVDAQIGKILEKATASGGSLSDEDKDQLAKLQAAKQFGFKAVKENAPAAPKPAPAPSAAPASTDKKHLGFFSAMKKAFTEGIKGNSVAYSPVKHQKALASEWQRHMEQVSAQGKKPDVTQHPLHKILGELPNGATEEHRAMAGLFQKRLDEAIAKESPTAIRTVQKQYLRWLEEEELIEPKSASQKPAPNPYLKHLPTEGA